MMEIEWSIENEIEAVEELFTTDELSTLLVMYDKCDEFSFEYSDSSASSDSESDSNESCDKVPFQLMKCYKEANPAVRNSFEYPLWNC